MHSSSLGGRLTVTRSAQPGRHSGLVGGGSSWAGVQSQRGSFMMSQAKMVGSWEYLTPVRVFCSHRNGSIRHACAC